MRIKPELLKQFDEDPDTLTGIHKVSEDGLEYCLFEGGYLKPEDVLDLPADILRVKEALKVYEEFKDLIENTIIEYDLE